MTGEPIPHWPGRMVSLGDHEVYLRSVSGDGLPPAQPRPGGAWRDGLPATGGSGSGEAAAAEAALCVHGLEGSSRNWTDLMEALRPRLDCDALDLPGFGSSPPRPDRGCSIGAFAETVSALIERRGRGPVHLIGNSLGGAVSVRVAARRPDLVRTLTLISPALPDRRARPDLLRFPLMSVPGVGAWLLDKFKVLPPERRVANVIATCYYDPGRYPRERFAAEVAELARRDSLGYADAVLVGCVLALVAETLRVGRATAWRDAARVTAPTLVIYGSHDRLVDPRAAGRAARAFRDARVVVLPRTGHVAQMEHPDLVAAEIGVLLDGAGAGRRAGEFPLAPAG